MGIIRPSQQLTVPISP